MAQEQVGFIITAKNLASTVVKKFNEDLLRLKKTTDEVAKAQAQWAKTSGDPGFAAAQANLLRFNQVGSEGYRLTKSMGDAMAATKTEAKDFGEGMKAAADFGGLFNTRIGQIPRLGQVASTAIKAMTASLGGMATAVILATGGIALITGAIALFARWLGNASQEGREYQDQLLGLQTVANNFGISQEQINQAVQRLTANGLLNQQQAVTNLSRVFQSYTTNVEDAVNVVEMMEDFAASGGKAHISFADKVDKLTESYLTQMSILGNNAGLQENWNQIIKVGERITGQKYAAESKMNQELIKRAGLEAIHARAVGAAANWAKTYNGVIETTKNRMSGVRLELSTALIPAYATLWKTVQDAMGAGQGFIKVLRAIGIVAVTLTTILRSLANAVASVFSAFIQGMKGNFKGALNVLKTGLGKQIDVWSDYATDVGKIWRGEIEPAVKGVTSGLPDWAKEGSDGAAKAYRDMLEQLKKANEDYQRNLENLERDFKRSVADMVWDHKQKVIEVKSDIEDETKAFKRANEERYSDLLKTLMKMEDAHNRKVRDTNQDLEDEEVRHANAVDKIQQDIRDEEAKGIWLLGRWNSQANEERLRDLRRALVEEQEAHARKVRDLQQRLDDENADYAASVAEKNELYQEDTANATESYNEKIAELEKALKEEEDLLAKHSDLVAMVADMKKEDDFERLVRGYEEQKAEMARQHAETIENIRKNAEEQGAATGQGFTEGLGGGVAGAGGIIPEEMGQTTDWLNNDFTADTDTWAANFDQKWSDFWTGVGGTVRSWAETTWGTLSTWWSNTAIGQAIWKGQIKQYMYDLFTRDIPFAVGFALSWIDTKWTNFNTWFDQWWTDQTDFINTKLEGWITSAQNWVDETIKKAEQFARDLPKNVKEAAEGAKRWLEDAPDSLKNLMGRAADWISQKWEGVKNMFGDIVRNFQEGIRLGAISASSHQHGGVVPGKPGQAVPIIAHAGERVVPVGGVDVNARSMGTRGGVVINMTGPVSMRTEADIQMLADKIVKMLGRRNELERLGASLGG